MLISSTNCFHKNRFYFRREDQLHFFSIMNHLTGNFRIFFAKQNGQQRRSEATINAIDLNIYIYAEFSKFFLSKSKIDVSITIWWF